jgi:hypothetical protein
MSGEQTEAAAAESSLFGYLPLVSGKRNDRDVAVKEPQEDSNAEGRIYEKDGLNVCNLDAYRSYIRLPSRRGEF